jgi:hypothetical protein
LGSGLLSVDIVSIEDTIDGDLEIVRGDSQTWEDTVHEIENDVPEDITGAALTMTVKNKYTDDNSEALFQKTTTGGGIVVDPNQVTNIGKYQFTVDPADTDSLDFGVYVYDIQMVLGGRLETISKGLFCVLSESTHA